MAINDDPRILMAAVGWTCEDSNILHVEANESSRKDRETRVLVARKEQHWIQVTNPEIDDTEAWKLIYHHAKRRDRALSELAKANSA